MELLKESILVKNKQSKEDEGEGEKNGCEILAKIITEVKNGYQKKKTLLETTQPLTEYLSDLYKGKFDNVDEKIEVIARQQGTDYLPQLWGNKDLMIRFIHFIGPFIQKSKLKLRLKQVKKLCADLFWYLNGRNYNKIE